MYITRYTEKFRDVTYKYRDKYFLFVVTTYEVEARENIAASD